jgi:site-specific DNA-adenine methylase
MKNHFFYPYVGNKRSEVDKIYEKLIFDDIDTIIEPFCGSSAISYYISTKQPLKYKYVLNDNSKQLINFYNFVKNADEETLIKFNNDVMEKIKTFDKEKYKLLNYDDDNLIDYFILNTVYYRRIKLFPLPDVFEKKFKNRIVDVTKSPIYNFLKNENITFTCEDAITCYEKYKGCENVMIIFDPPYLMSHNCFYTNANVNIYQYLHKNNINNERARIYGIFEKIWIIEMLFENQIKYEYAKLYQISKRRTNHIIIGNNILIIK